MSVLPLARTGTVVSSLCNRSAAKTCASTRRRSGASTAQQPPTWSARVDRLRGTPSLAYARRPFFQMADLAATARRKAQGKTLTVISPLALEAVRRIDALFEIERSINGQSAERRRAVRQELSAPLVADLESWLREQRAKLSRGNDLAKAMDYMLKRWPAFTVSLR